MKNRLKFNVKGGLNANNCILILLFVILIVLTIKTLCNSFGYEMSHAYTADSPLYWTVGRGF